MSYIIARDRKNKKVLLGGLGTLGMGKMWVSEAPFTDEEAFKTAPEFGCQSQTFVDWEDHR